MKINARPPRPKPREAGEARRPSRRRRRRPRRRGGPAVKRLRRCGRLARSRWPAARRSGRDDLSLRQRVHQRGVHGRDDASSPSARHAEQRAEARDVARREKALAAEMARDRREQEALRQAGAGRLAERAARRGRAGAAGDHEATPKKHSEEGRDRRRARLRRRRARRRRSRELAAAASTPRGRVRLGPPPPPAGAGTWPAAARAISTCAGLIGMHSTGQTCTHCGASKWPTHSVHLCGVDDVVSSPIEIACVRALGFADVAVDALVGDHQGHGRYSVSRWSQVRRA